MMKQSARTAGIAFNVGTGSIFGDWSELIGGIGDFLWSYITATGAQIMATIASWATIIAQVGNLAWNYLTKTAEDIMTVIASWANIIAQVGNLAWANLSKTAEDIMTTIGTWANIIGQVGGTAVDVAGDIATGAINVVGQMVDNFFTGVAGLGKFIAGFFTADDTGRGKFEELFVNTALIDNLAVETAKIKDLAVTEAKIGDLAVGTAKIKDLNVTTAKIDDLAVAEGKIGALAVTNAKIGLLAVDTAQIADLAVQAAKIGALAVTTAKIDNLAVETGKIKDLAVSEAKIATAAITNLKILSGTIEFSRVAGDFARYSYYDHNRWVTSIEALTGYQTATANSGGFLTRRNYMQLYTGLTASSWAKIYGYALLDCANDPTFKCKVEYVSAIEQAGPYFKLGVGDMATITNKHIGFNIKQIGVTQFVRVYFTRGDGTNGEEVFTNDVFSEGETHILECFIDSSAGVGYWYIDGVLEYQSSNYIPTTGKILDFFGYVNNDTYTKNLQWNVYYFTTTEDWQ